MKFRRLITFLILLVIIILGVGFGIEKYAFPIKYEEYVTKYSEEYNLDPYFVLSVMKAESNFNPNAKSNRNALGLMQITEETGEDIAKWMGLEDYDKSKLYDEEYNIMMGCWYLNNLNKEFNNNETLVLSAYNAGRGNVNDWLSNEQYSKDGKNLDYIPFGETKKYVDKIDVYYKVYKFLYQ